MSPETHPITIAAFYKFVRVDDPASLRSRLLADMSARDMKGTILVAPEGINGTISGTTAAMRDFLAMLRGDTRFADLVTKAAAADAHPFKRRKVKLKREILTFRQHGSDPTRHGGAYVPPEQWNALISEPDVLVLDTRNNYEFEVGTFDHAVDPKIRRFTEFADYVKANLDPERHRKVAMFCTGGIRCEKASAYMLSLGFAEVYHLEGGILNYLAHMPAEASLWRGQCFVFDEREAVS